MAERSDLLVAVEEAACPVCGTSVPATLARCCERCDTPHHGDCWDYAGGCAIFGCARECASHSRESSLSSSSSSSSPPSPPAFHRWLWTYRLYAWALSVFGVGAALWAGTRVTLLLIGLVTGLFPLRMGSPVPEAFFMLDAVFSALLGLAVFLAGLVMTATLVPAFLLRRQAEAALTTGLTPPREGVRSVLDRLDPGALSSRLLRILRFASPVARVLGWLALAVLLGGVVLLVEGDPDFLGSVLLGAGLAGVMTTWPLAVARDRLTWVETLQNRVTASFKVLKSS